MDAFKRENITVYNCDCMELMETFSENEFDLAVVDPPYGIKADKGFGGFDGFGGLGKPIKRREYNQEWDSSVPDKSYFDDLLMVSEQQIIWGSNFFTDMLPQWNHWIFWDKLNTMPTFSDGELAATSFRKNSVKKITINNNGCMSKEKNRIHPTQKPIALYSWIYAKYAKPGQRILDTHLGSGSNAIAAHYAGLEFVGCEFDKEYFEKACERIIKETRQIDMFGRP